MEEKNIALCILGVVAILALVGLILLFTAQQAGASVAAANRNSMVPYPGGVARAPTAQVVVREQPSYVQPSGQYYKTSGELTVEPAKLPYPQMFEKTVN